ncbi:glycosyltransferase family 4 protein [Gilvimarinus sp. F26214L]
MTTDTVGGVWTYSMELCGALRERGVSIELASMGRRLSPEQREEVAALPNVRLHESDFRLCWMHDPWDDVEAAGKWLLDLEAELKPDLVQLNDLGHGGLPWRSPLLLVGHSCVYSWWAAVKNQQADAQWNRYRETVRASVGNADCLVAPTRAMLDALLQFYGPAANCQVIANGRSYPPLTSRHTALPAGGGRSHARMTLIHHEGSEAIVFAAGRVWDEAKNIGTLVGVADTLPWPVYVAGEQAEPGGEGQPGPMAGPRAHYLGYLDKTEMARWLRRAGIYVAPAYYEPFGLGILEAARAGCALVLGDIPSLREIWEDAALYVPPDQPDLLRAAISELAHSPARRKQMSARAWQRAQRYTTERMARDYQRCYRNLIDKPAGSSRDIRSLAGAKT